VSCFNECCRDLNQALTPYDLLRLRSCLGIDSREFFRRYADIHAGPASGLPVASLRFDDRDDRRCPFVTGTGCRVYADRPSSCRLYPLARALYRSRATGALDAQYAIVREPHCRGFDQGPFQNLNQWIAGQGLEIYFRMNDPLIELIALKNRLRPGPLPARLQQQVQLAFYDIDSLKTQVAPGRMGRLHQQAGSNRWPPAPGPEDDDTQWLAWSLNWVRHLLFGGNP
jgi:Fe-S-cluster containining protein